MKTIIEMAREARAISFIHDAGEMPFKWLFTRKELERFADLVRADEREENAKVCDARAIEYDGFTEEQNASEKLAAAIRARGNT